MTAIRCDVAMAALVATVESGSALTDDVRQHLQECERCSGVLDGARALEQTLASHGAGGDQPESPEVAAAVEREAKRVRRDRIVARVLITIVSLMVFGFLLFVSVVGEPDEGVWVFVAGVSIALLLSIPLFAVVSLARSARNNRAPLYKRLGPGKQLSGVCMGLAERTGWPVTVFRLIFVGLLFVDGFGLILYILFDMAMPVHPADRQYLLRFRLARAWREFRDRRMARPT